MTFHINKAPRYVGLSYAWGDTTLCQQIIVGGRLLHITQNLAVALEHLQEQHKTLVLWVDAVCINQQDSYERSKQVQMMGRIFMSATVVIAWLGPSKDESDVVIQQIKKFSLPAPHTQKPSVADLMAALPLDLLRVFLNRPWFYRVWVMQEIALNNEVIFACGREDISKWRLLRVISFTAAILTSFTNDFHPFHFGRFAYRKPRPLGEYIASPSGKMATWFGQCLHSSEPRDFVFSLFGTINDLERHQLKSDYSKTVEEIYTDFAEAVVGAGKIGALSRLWRPSSRYPKLPSWIPDWSATFMQWLDPHDGIPGLNAEVCCTHEGNRVLRIHALRIDNIKHTEHSNVDNDIPSAMSQEELCQFLTKLRTTLSCFPNIHSPEKIDSIVYKMSIATSRTAFYKTTPSKEELYESYLIFRGLTRPLENSEDPVAWQSERSRPYLSALQHSNIQHIFVTSGGIVGLTGDEIQAGDSLFLLPGLRGFWVIRERKPGQYRLISSASASGYQHSTFIHDRVEVIDIY